jgi:predicted  nucleic acid-binding Zn-ribbon protein
VALSALALAVSLISARASRNRGEIDQLGRRLDAAEDRITRVEGEVAHLPDKDTAHRLEMAVARLEGRLETMDERLKPVAAMASRMQDAMLEGRK